jgi:transcriptional regulator with XRE-family HTH domain
MIPDEIKDGAFPAKRDPGEIADAVRQMLRARGFTLYRVALLARERYPHASAFHIRRNFYSQLRSGLTPTFLQVATFAELTGLPLWDWLAVFGFPPSEIPRLQSLLPRPRTGLIDKDVVDRQALLPLLRYRRPGAALPVAAPLSQLLEQVGSCPADGLLGQSRGDFVYAKIGTADAFAFPHLVPGSIVRADPQLVGSSLPAASGGTNSRRLFLVEHSRGLNCGRLRVSGPGRVAFLTRNPALANVEFRLGPEARILGVLDLELRFQPASGQRETARLTPPIPSSFAESRNPPRLNAPAGRGSRALLETARLRAGLSFRSASKLSLVISRILGDRRYFASPGTLSDYEAGDQMPRHIHKLFTLAIVYSVAFRVLLRSFGIARDDFGKGVRAHETTVSREQRTSGERIQRTSEEPRNDFLEDIQSQFGDLPLFLGSALPDLSGLSHISLRDVFWIGGQANERRAALQGALFVLVNRRSKKPRIFSRMPLLRQPLYLLQERAGPYLVAICAIEDGRLAVYAYPQESTEGQGVRRHVDADIVGQIVGVARSLLSPP